MLKYILLAFLLSYGHFLIAADLKIEKGIKEIDSLISFNHHEEAETQANNLYKVLGNKKHLEQLLTVRFQQAVIADNQFDHRDALPIFIEVLDQAEKNGFYKLACKTYIRIAFNQEKADNFDVAYKHLKTAANLCTQHGFNELYSAILMRHALLHRFLGDTNVTYITERQRQNLANLGFKGNVDSAVYYTQQTIAYALKYRNEYDLNEAYVTMGILFGKKRKNRPAESSAYFLRSIPYWEKTNNFEYVGMMYSNVALNYFQNDDPTMALQYNDSGYKYYNRMSLYYKPALPKQRAQINYALKKLDSAYYYLQIAYTDDLEKVNKEEQSNNRRLEEQFQHEKSQAVIKNKNQQIIYITSLLGVIALATLLLIRKNREISRKNKTINKQLGELSKMLEQKQVLLSELQHRVKNNLQHVISILEIQKESVDFNNIDELIRGNQNRIHSMALLHKKLNVSDNVNEVDLGKYISELSELVKDSYDGRNKKVNLQTKCDIGKVSLEKALPLGLIIVELVSNSMKHAFKNRSLGMINIEITIDENQQQHKLYYADNGRGFDFNLTSKKGLGQEIIKGLIDQLNANFETYSDNGFELMVYFK